MLKQRAHRITTTRPFPTIGNRNKMITWSRFVIHCHIFHFFLSDLNHEETKPKYPERFPITHSKVIS